MARTIWGDHKRYYDTYFSAFKNKYFTGDGAMRNAVGYYRITGRVDDVIIVSGHNLGTAPIEDAINEHPAVSESAIVGFPHDVKGNALYGFVILKEVGETRDRENLKKEGRKRHRNRALVLGLVRVCLCISILLPLSLSLADAELSCVITTIYPICLRCLLPAIFLCLD